MVQIKITPEAQKDLKGIFRYISKDSPKNAQAVSEAIIRKIDTLFVQTSAGKIVKEFAKSNIRELNIFKYRIIYRVASPSLVEIITIHHSSRLITNNPYLQDFFD